MVQTISDDYSLGGIVEAHRSDLIVIDFYADWCGPCRMIAPLFEQLSQRYNKGVLFLKVNVDLCRQTATSYDVRAMPTFIFLVNGKEVDRLRGANPSALEEKVVQHMKAASASAKKTITATDDERKFLEKFTNYSRRMVIYEDEIAKTLALSLIPSAELKEKSLRNGKVDQLELIKNLIRWFKTEFFSWVDIPACEGCCSVPTQDTRVRGAVLPEERRFGAHDVEIYNCTSCSTTVRFPRYNDPTKLLETRKGRCGEWANCFVLCCRAMDFETRWIYDVTDHVWCEVWIESLGRWMHCDPCEGVCDTPLLYERGWGKKLTYVIAFGVDHIRDVTWRYTFDHKKTIGRRIACREAVLRSFLRKLNARYEHSMSSTRKAELERRYMKELIEFLSPNMQIRSGSSAEKQGRITGSEQWKKERGEAGVPHTPVTISPNKSEIEAKVFRLEYNCFKDEYKRGKELINGWEKMAFKQRNIFRKEEQDWKKTYLCREEGAPDGEIIWSFDFLDADVKDVEIEVRGMAEFNNGKLLAAVCSGDICSMLGKDGKLKLEKLRNGKLEVKVAFSAGDGDRAWQHSQLFRSDFDSAEPDLIITAHFA